MRGVRSRTRNTEDAAELKTAIDRKSAEEIVRRSEQRLKTIIDAVPLCVKVVSPEGALLDMNRAGLEMIGAGSVAEILGRPIIDLVHPEDRERFLALHVAASRGTRGRAEFRIIALNGNELWVDSHLVPFDPLTDRPDVRTVLSVMSDVTAQKQLEEQRRQGQKMEAIGLLAGGVAHDFNNLLTVIAGYADLVLNSTKEDDARHADLVEIVKAAERAVGLTRQLLAFSRRQVFETRVLDLNDLITDVHKLLRRTIPEHIELTLDLEPDLAHVRADPGQLEQVILNLAVNARDAMPHGGHLRFTTRAVEVDSAFAQHHPPMLPGRYVQVFVSDTGIGMSPETQARIFEPFFTTKELGKGTGLGLATVYGIVKQSGGFIWVSSQPNQGTTFQIYLPAVQEAVEPDVSTVRAPEPLGGSETILLAEDDEAVRRFAHEVLQKRGYVVLEARNGAEALAIFQRSKIQIHMLLTDVVMPGLTGQQLAERVTVHQPGIRVLYTTGYSEKVTTGTGLAHGSPLLSKPYSPGELLYKVREILDAKSD